MGKFNSIDDLNKHIAGLDEEPVKEETTEVEEPVKEETTEVEEPVKEETTEVEEPVTEETTEVEEPVKEETTEVEEPVTEETTEVEPIIYKSMGAEHKIEDDFILKAAKTPEQREKIKRLYEKASGLDHIEQKNKRLSEQMAEVEPVLNEHKDLKTEINFYNKLLDQKKHHELFRQINITDDDVLKVAHNILQYKELTPEQRMAYDNNMQSTQRLHQLELQTQQLQEQVRNSTTSSHEEQLNSVLERPDVKQVISNYDSRIGQEGAFRNEVINRAALVEMQSKGKTVLSPEEAVNQVLKVIGHVTESQSQQAGGNTEESSQSTSQSQVVRPTKKPVIPNVQGGSKSPAKKVFKSIADLRKHAESLGDY